MLGILFGDLVDCGACFSRPHNIFGRVWNVEVKPPILDTRPSWVLRSQDPVGAQGRHRSRVGNLSEAMPAFGEVPETL